MKLLKQFVVVSALAALSLPAVGCGDDDEMGTAGSGGDTAGSGGSTAGSGGDTAGSGGSMAGGGGAGGAGGGEPAACNLSKEGRPREAIPFPTTGTITLTSDKLWELDGVTHVADGEVLTIEPCTVIEGQPVNAERGGPSTLVVSRGGQIMAAGERDRPILFTTWADEGERAAGQWGGVILLGRAPTNQGDEVLIEGLFNDAANRFGGNLPEDNSGVFTYVRIEYNGYELAPADEVNGLTMGGVGSGTEIHHVMVSHNIDDCFEWFGGTVNAHHLICNEGEDDMFDADLGYTGEVHTIFGRYTRTSSTDPHGFEIDGNRNNPASEPFTNFQVSKATLCGPGMPVGPTTRGMVLRRGAKGSIDDVVSTGFQNAVSLRNNHGTAEDPAWRISNALLFGFDTFGDDSTDATANDEQAWFDAGDDNMSAATGPFTVADCQAEGGPAAAVLNSGRGAFRDDADWMTGMWVDWTEADEIN